jgi:hypothetical protein
MSSHTTSTHKPPIAAILVVPVVVALVLTLFAWPTAKVGPRDVPIGVAGTPAMEQQLAAQDDKFEVHRYAGEADARAAIADREVYGAFVPGKLLTSSAGSPAISQMLTHAASESGRPVAIEDVVPTTQAGGALAASVLPMVIAGILTGAFAFVAGGSALRRTGLLVAGSALTGLVATLIIQSWLGVVAGDWLTNAGVLSLAVLAISATVTGLGVLFGRVGAIAAALTMVFIGNPFSGVASGPEMLPAPAGAIGQLLPPGAGGNLLRSTGFFDGAAAGQHVAVLVAWVALGLVCVAVAGLPRIVHRRTEVTAAF